MPSPATSERPELLSRIAQHALATPSHTALTCEGRTLSYAELWAAAGEVADALLRRGLASGERVLLAGRRSAEDYIHLLGILRAGGVYVPLGSSPVIERARYISGHVGARFLLGCEPDPDLATALGFAHAAATVPNGQVFESSQASLSGDAAQPGYILFTSGSTGQPKGVAIGLDQIRAYIDNLLGCYPLTAEDRAAQLAELAFDASTHEIFSAWSAGAALVVVPRRNILMWPRYAREQAISTMLLVPSQVRLASASRVLRAGMLPHLRLAFLGAEAVTPEVVSIMRAAAPGAALVNLWGPTEATVAMTHHLIPVAPEAAVVPIGMPWTSGTVRLVQPDGSAALPGAIGELMIGGAQLTAGYWNAPHLTAGRFVEQDGTSWYRTGDLATFDPSSGYSFLGRRDRQVKINGYRIELEECEHLITTLSGCETGVLPRLSDDGHATALVAFVACETSRLQNVAELIRQGMPSYIAPLELVALAELPRSTSGKADLQALRAIMQQTPVWSVI